MEYCDVLIVGGGPAGSTCAWKLREAGFDVVVMDKRPFPRDKVCAGWITPAVVNSLQLDVEDYRRHCVFQPITGFRSGPLGGRAVEISYPRPVSYGILRCEFDHYLLERAGVRQRLGEPLTRLEPENGGWVVNNNLRASLIVGAGGHFCPVARHLGNRPGRQERVIAAQEVEFAMTDDQQGLCQIQESRPELAFCEDLKGYAWCFRKGAFLNIGLGREDSYRLSEHVTAFIESLKRQGRIPVDIPSRLKGHAYLLYTHTPRKVTDDRVMLIGDAAGLAYPRSGEGIRPAVESGLLAARVIEAAKGCYRRAAELADYEQALAERFGSRKPPTSSWVPEGLRQWLGQRLLTTRWFNRHVVLNRWFLHIHQPPLA